VPKAKANIKLVQENGNIICNIQIKLDGILEDVGSDRIDKKILAEMLQEDINAQVIKLIN
jgi:hypothetical protein